MPNSPFTEVQINIQVAEQEYENENYASALWYLNANLRIINELVRMCLISMGIFKDKNKEV